MDVMFKCHLCGETKQESLDEAEPGFGRRLAKGELVCASCG